ncbi:hypothetical protein RMCBS344292_01465 [Rhizopus microsporus]|nr:hypothetical protein RMCBS344292_01465 [Rhizopus microsporus]
MSMFLSKFLSGRNVAKTKLELLTEAWTNIQKYYETADDPLKDAVDLTPIPCSLQNIIKLIQAEEVEHQRPSGSLETGPCLEYLLQKRVLEELVEFAKVDTPYGMRIHCLRFFCSLVTNVQAQLLPERAVHVPLQKLITSCHRLIAHHYEQLTTDAEACSEERIAAISELSLELVKLMHGVFSHFKGANAALMDLFFERGWCRGLGESVWRSSKDGKTLHKRRESVEDKIAWNMFLTPRFDMFTYLIDYMNIPGETGEIAREAILFALRLLDDDPEYVCYIVEYSGLCEVMAERLSLYFASLPKNAGAFTISENNRVIPVRPPRRSIRFSVPAMITNNSLMITVNAQNSFKKKRRKRSPFDYNFVKMLESTVDKNRIVDDFYSFWEYLNDVARVAEKRLMTALMAQLTTMFWHPVVCTGLSSPSAEIATAATAYTTEMIRCLTDQRLVLSLLPLEDELERMKSPLLSNVVASDSLPSANEDGKNPYLVVPGNSYDDYFHEAQERFHYALLAKNFWQSPYPPVKSKKDIEREAEDRKGRPSRPKSMMAVNNSNDTTADQMSISSSVTNTTTTAKKLETYEGLFLSRIFDQFCKMLELPVEQNLLVTSILQKLAGVVDKRMDGVICDWRSIRVGNDGALYGGVWTLPSSKITFEALKRAQLVPNFETRISLAKKRGMVSGTTDAQSVSSYIERSSGSLRRESSPKLNARLQQGFNVNITAFFSPKPFITIRHEVGRSSAIKDHQRHGHWWWNGIT